MSEKTQAQIDAEVLLTEAVERMIVAYSGNSSKTPLLDTYVVCTSIQMLADDGTVFTGYPTFVMNGDIPYYKILGLLDVHREFAMKGLVSGESNG